MKKLEIINLLAVAACLIGLYNHVSGVYILFIVCTGTAALMYIVGAPAIFKGERKEVELIDVDQKSTDVKKNGLSTFHALVLGTGLALTLLGILFKIQQWMGAAPMFFVGLALLVIMTMVSLVGLALGRNRIHSKVLLRTITIGGLGFFLLFTSSTTLIEMQYKDHPAYIKAHNDLMADPTNEHLQQMEQFEYSRMVLSPEQFELYERDLELYERD